MSNSTTDNNNSNTQSNTTNTSNSTSNASNQQNTQSASVLQHSYNLGQPSYPMSTSSAANYLTPYQQQQYMYAAQQQYQQYQQYMYQQQMAVYNQQLQQYQQQQQQQQQQSSTSSDQLSSPTSKHPSTTQMYQHDGGGNTNNSSNNRLSGAVSNLLPQSSRDILETVDPLHSTDRLTDNFNTGTNANTTTQNSNAPNINVLQGGLREAIALHSKISKADANRDAISGRKIRRRRRRPATVGDMVDRLAEFERVKALLGSKNLACAALGCSKGTINAYTNSLRNAEYLGYNIEQIRNTKYKELKQMLAQHKGLNKGKRNSSVLGDDSDGDDDDGTGSSVEDVVTDVDVTPQTTPLLESSTLNSKSTPTSTTRQVSTTDKNINSKQQPLPMPEILQRALSLSQTYGTQTATAGSITSNPTTTPIISGTTTGTMPTPSNPMLPFNPPYNMQAGISQYGNMTPPYNPSYSAALQQYGGGMQWPPPYNNMYNPAQMYNYTQLTPQQIQLLQQQQQQQMQQQFGLLSGIPPQIPPIQPAYTPNSNTNTAQSNPTSSVSQDQTTDITSNNNNDKKLSESTSN